MNMGYSKVRQSDLSDGLASGMVRYPSSNYYPVSQNENDNENRKLKNVGKAKSSFFN